MSVAELAELTGLAVNTIRRAEGTNEIPTITVANMKLLANALEDAGVILIPADSMGPGVRFRAVDASTWQSRRRKTPDAG